ncbi:protein FAM200C-like [Palaemon carinicauda]|uniref:protein FAM200C-like n=1 Tax=Palaemon carinicauda TaxID=392227 RepID=UPI0035B60A6A
MKELVTKQLPKLENRFCDYFPELDSHTVKCELVDLPEEPEGLAEEVIELRSNSETSMKFETKDDLSNFYMAKMVKAYKTAQLEPTKMLPPFTTAYLCEQDLSTLVYLKPKYRTWLVPKGCCIKDETL